MRRKTRRGLLISAAIMTVCVSAPSRAQVDRTILPLARPAFDGVIADNVLDARPGTARPAQVPKGAPNILLFMADDVGFAMSSAFGGPVPTPNMEKLAAQGQRYNRFHTTGICSPSRAALLTGRNSHNAGTGFLSDMPAPFPGYGGKMLSETATIAQILRLNGYSTAMFGKHHNVPGHERSAAGPFDAWPTGLGFDYFYGFLAGDTDQYQPALYRGISRIETDEQPDTLLDQRLADDMIGWIHNQKAGAPDKPFFAYLSPGSAHAPHQAPPAYIARFKGRFDQGWDRLREETLARQIAAGIVPRGTKLSARPDAIPAWSSLNAQAKAFAARTMEVAAAQLVLQDEQLGRVIDELDRMGELDRTLIAVIQGDNGASGEAGPGGTVNELRTIGTHDEDQAWLTANLDRLGGPQTYQNYPVGWAWAMNAPFPWVKQYASMLGGIRNGMILAWPGHVAQPGAVCAQFSHLIDIAPTLLDAATLPAPSSVLGVAQKPIDGQSLLPSLGACNAAAPRTQYFEINGKVSLYHDGWFLSGEDGRPAWEFMPPTGPRPTIQWSLYNLDRDFSQSRDLAMQEPKRLAEMQSLWRTEAMRNNVFPMDHRFGAARYGGLRAAPGASATQRFTYWGKDVTIPANAAPRLSGRAFTVEADVRLDKDAASGVVMAIGSRFGGWSLHLDKGRPTFTFARSTDPREISSIAADRPLRPGATTLRLRFTPMGEGTGARISIEADGQAIAQGQSSSSVMMPAGGGESLDIGRDLGVPVTSYATAQGTIEGDVRRVVVTFD